MRELDATYALVRLTYPTLEQEPVTFNQVIKQAKIDKSAAVKDADLIAIYIAAARDYVEAKSRTVLAPSDWKIILDTFAFDPIPLSLFPLNSVSQIQYYDQNNVLKTVDPISYNVDLLTAPGRIQLVYGQIWPYTAVSRPDSVILYVNAGYTQTSIPPTYRLAVLMLAAEFYQRRLPVTELRLAEIPVGIDRLIAANYRGVYI
jgi:uncharacterized phiE125 gp8 family phage protein